MVICLVLFSPSVFAVSVNLLQVSHYGVIRMTTNCEREAIATTTQTCHSQVHWPIKSILIGVNRSSNLALWNSK